MNYCEKCGANLDPGVTVCPYCGTAYAPQPDPNAQKNAGQQSATDQIRAKLNKLNDTADTTNEYDKADIEQNKVMALLSYLSWLVLIPIFAAPNSKYARFHANQGLILLIAEFALGLVSGIITGVMALIASIIGAALGSATFLLGLELLVFLVAGLLNVVSVVFLVLGILNAINGKAKELPIIGKYRLLK